MLQNLTFIAGEATVGKTVLTDAMTKAINQGIADLTVTFNDVLAIVIPAAIVLIAVNAGANFALGKIRGLMGWAQ